MNHSTRKWLLTAALVLVLAAIVALSIPGVAVTLWDYANPQPGAPDAGTSASPDGTWTVDLYRLTNDSDPVRVRADFSNQKNGREVTRVFVLPARDAAAGTSDTELQVDWTGLQWGEVVIGGASLDISARAPLEWMPPWLMVVAFAGLVLFVALLPIVVSNRRPTWYGTVNAAVFSLIWLLLSLPVASLVKSGEISLLLSVEFGAVAAGFFFGVLEIDALGVQSFERAVLSKRSAGLGNGVPAPPQQDAVSRRTVWRGAMRRRVPIGPLQLAIKAAISPTALWLLAGCATFMLAFAARILPIADRVDAGILALPAALVFGGLLVIGLLKKRVRFAGELPIANGSLCQVVDIWCPYLTERPIPPDGLYYYRDEEALWIAYRSPGFGPHTLVIASDTSAPDPLLPQIGRRQWRRVLWYGVRLRRLGDGALGYGEAS